MKNSNSLIKIQKSWLNHIECEFDKEYMDNIKKELIKRKSEGKIIFPPNELIFNSLNLTSFEDTKLVIIGQDPYHKKFQAHGLSFSVPDGIKPPPSLINIFKEIEQDLKIKLKKTDGNLTKWAKQGVLLLNSTLTVEEGDPLSHENIGGNIFTDKIISILSNKKSQLVFFLWGSHARSKINLIDSSRHMIIESPHPSPLSAHRGFFGSKPFSKANNFFNKNKITPINWS